MAAVARTSTTTQTDIAERMSEDRVQTGAIVRLAILHAEAEETARLANLLGRSLYAALVLPAIGALSVGLVEGGDLARQLVWGGFVVLVSLAMLRAYAHTIGQPFERVALKNFAKDMSAILLFAGFAWGAGAFLVLPAGAGVAAALLFTVAPSIAVAALLREREAVFLFLAPMALLASFASVLRPFAEGALDAALILLACAAIAGATALLDRRGSGDAARPAMLPST